MTDTPLERLQEATRDVWADPVVAAHRAAESIIELLEGDWNDAGVEAISELRRRRADSPFILAITEAALATDAETRHRVLHQIMERLDDRTWADDLGLRIAHHETVGVVSLGETTLAVLEAARGLGGTSAALFTDRRAIARGLTYLGLMIEVAPPDEAAAVLIPAAAIMASRMWTTVRAADVALRAALHHAAVVVVAHPLADLSTRNRADFRPASALIDVKI
jgi:hypothetical protein